MKETTEYKKPPAIWLDEQLRSWAFVVETRGEVALADFEACLAFEGLDRIEEFLSTTRNALGVLGRTEVHFLSDKAKVEELYENVGALFTNLKKIGGVK